jgi:hypothetical protein
MFRLPLGLSYSTVLTLVICFSALFVPFFSKFLGNHVCLTPYFELADFSLYLYRFGGSVL